MILLEQRAYLDRNLRMSWNKQNLFSYLRTIFLPEYIALSASIYKLYINGFSNSQDFESICLDCA